MREGIKQCFKNNAFKNLLHTEIRDRPILFDALIVLFLCIRVTSAFSTQKYFEPETI